MRNKKVIWISVAVVVVAAIVVLNFTTNTKKSTDVTAVTVGAMDLTEQVSASGRIQPQTFVDITAQISGKIISLPVKEGDPVIRGNLLVVLDTVQLRSDLDQARYAVSEIDARLNGAKTSLDQAREEHERQQRLLKQNLTPETTAKDAMYAYEAAKSNYTAMEAQAEQTKSGYDKALDNLSKAKIVAPMDGVITLVDCEVGEIAAAQNAFTQGKTLMTISNMNIFEVEVEVDETEIVKIQLGQKAKIQVDAFQDTSFAGSVAEIGNTAIIKGSGTQDQSTNFKVKIIFAEANAGIRPGMSATVDITTNERKDILGVPYSAIVMRSFDMDSLEAARKGEKGETSMVSEVQAAEGDSANPVKPNGAEETERKELKGVFVVRDGVARFIEVQTGIADQKHIEIKSGLQKGDSVISGPYRILRTVKDGENVKTSANKGPGEERKEA